MAGTQAVSVGLAVDREACKPFLARAFEFDVEGGKGTFEGLGDAAIFEMRDGARLVGAFALEVNSYADGHHVRVLAAGGEPGFDLTAAMVHAVEREARERIGAQSIGCETRRPGLVKKLQAQGFHVSGFILRKVL